MHKRIGYLMVIYLLLSARILTAQTVTDSGSSVTIDSTLANRMRSDSGIESGENNEDGFPEPVSDSPYTFTGSVREVPSRHVRSYTSNPDYAYANDSTFLRANTTYKPGLLAKLLNSIFFWRVLLVGAILLVLTGIYKLAKENSFGWLARKRRNYPTAGETQLQGAEPDTEAAIQQYLDEGNHRMAIRYMYIRLIETMREKEIIPFRDSSTNAEILRSMDNHPRAGDFRFAVMAYEYIFYGGLHPRRDLFDRIKNNFDSLQQSFSS